MWASRSPNHVANCPLRQADRKEPAIDTLPAALSRWSAKTRPNSLLTPAWRGRERFCGSGSSSELRGLLVKEKACRVALDLTDKPFEIGNQIACFAGEPRVLRQAFGSKLSDGRPRSGDNFSKFRKGGIGRFSGAAQFVRDLRNIFRHLGDRGLKTFDHLAQIRRDRADIF